MTASRARGRTARSAAARTRSSPRSSATPARSWCRARRCEFTWRNSEQLDGDLVEAVTALKNEPGGEIGMSGSVSVVRQLLAAGLLDELHLLVHPIVVGKGMRLFDDGESIPLKLLSSSDVRDRGAVPRVRQGRGARRYGVRRGQDAPTAERLNKPNPRRHGSRPPA